MANTTFQGPVVSLNGIIGGPNPNAGSGANDTEQGGKVVYSFSNTTTITIASGQFSGTNLLATASEGALVYTSDCISGVAGYVFSDGTTWKQVNSPSSDISDV
jgi:hypothetical protein